MLLAKITFLFFTILLGIPMILSAVVYKRGLDAAHLWLFTTALTGFITLQWLV